ncbi:MAG: TIGR04551 family protein [Deltaproteobacteria bacterium]|nr:TIGR04551 family protein [Deltaproteobacteria bacterium]
MRVPALTSLVALSICSLSICSLSICSHAFAQTAEPGSLSQEELDGIRSEVQKKLEAELLEQVRAEAKAELAKQEATPSPFDAERWKWEEPDTKGLGFLSFDGYLRFRYSLFHRLDLGTYAADADDGPVGPFAAGVVAPVPICSTNPECEQARGPDQTLAGANLRFRLEPTLDVYEDVRIRTQIDVFDRLVLGSTPDGFPKNDTVPLLAFSQTQLWPSNGINALADSIRVKRVWAEITTSLGQIRAGRMPSHFGLGLLSSSGSDLDANDGDTVDRLMFATKIGGYYVMPAFEWGASGPTSANPGELFGQPFDRDQRDDVDRYVLIVAKGDSEGREAAARARGETVIDYGAYAIYETQTFESPSEEPKDSATTNTLFARDAELFMASLWGRLAAGDLELEAELVGTFGSYREDHFEGSERNVDVLAVGAAATTEYRLLGDSLTLRLLLAAAAGDRAPGLGVRSRQEGRTPKAGDFDGPQDLDGDVTNYRFNPDFRVDRILWRQLVGAVTDALIVKPGVQYNLTKGLGARLDAIYSRAMFAASTPSGSFDPTHDLGVELDAKLFYESENFVAALEYGVLFPLAGLNSQITRGGAKEVLEASAAQTIEATLAVTF